MTAPPVVAAPAPAVMPTPAITEPTVVPTAAPVTPAAAPVSTPPAPAPETIPAAPVTSPAEPKLLSKREAQQAAGERLKAALVRETPTPPGTPPVTPEVPPASLAVSPPPVTGAEASPVTPGAPVTPVPDALRTPVEPLRKIEIDPHHPALGGRKLDTITVESQREEEFVRSLLNGTYYRRQDVERSQSRLQQLEEENRTLRRQVIERETVETARNEWEGTPAYQAALEEYTRIKETVGEKAALNYWLGAQTDFQKAAKTKLTERITEDEAQEAQRIAQDWERTAYDRTADWLLPAVRDLPQFAQWFQDAARAFDAELALGLIAEAVDYESMHKAFVPYLQSRLMAKTTVREVLARLSQEQTNQTKAAADAAAKAVQDKKAIEDAAVARYLKEQAEKRAVAPPNPLAGVAATSRPVAPAATPEPTQPPATGHEAKRIAREAGARIARQRFGGQP